MSELVVAELMLLLRALKLGIWIAVVYDLLRIFRRIITHNVWAIGVEDGLYWCYVGSEFFKLLYEYNEGRLRWYLIAGAMIGMLLYSITIGRSLVRFSSRIICYLKGVFYRTYTKTRKTLALPYGKAVNKYQAKKKAFQISLSRQSSKFRKRLRNQLTQMKKMVKIILCKQ
ncbi:MAG: hypothetical protein E7299_01265 [Lachnospiraceae bacterium]|nr:hypothetical protein [Lachnospiraceae bacterium]